VDEGLISRHLVEPTDGSAGPLLRIAEDRLMPGAGYGAHSHADVDVVAVVLSGSLAHGWGGRATLRAGDVGILRAGTGLVHDEVAGADGAHVLQTYLRTAAAGQEPGHRLVRWSAVAARGWVDLGRPDARLWVARVQADDTVAVPAGLRVVATRDEVWAAPAATTGEGRVSGPAMVCVWQLDRARPLWAVD
jgi:redox-sensitive bicupin YhaK (pirin superfamily)